MEFQERLQQKQRDAATRALLDAIVEDPTQSISAVMASLEDDEDASYFSEVFKELSLGQIWIATLTALLEGRITTDALKASLGDDASDIESKLIQLAAGMGRDNDTSNGRDVTPLEASIIGAFADSTMTGEDEEENEYADASDDVEDEAPAKPRRRKAKGKGKDKKAKAKGKGKAKGKDKKKAPPKAAAVESEALDLSDAKMQKAYRKSIMDYLKANNCLDFDSGAPAQKIREVVSGSPKQLRDELAGLISDEKITYDGKARGTKYFLL